MKQKPSKENIKIAKEIIGKWGYEEEYWWLPIAEALQTAQKEVQTAMTNAILGVLTTKDIKLLGALNKSL